MTDSGPGSPSVAGSWDSYWRGSPHGTAYTGGGSTHPSILSYWHELFAMAGNRYAAPRILDLASGNGAVIERATKVLRQQPVSFTCLDISAAAIKSLESRFPGIQGIVADVRSIPFESARYDLVTSQFGIEYAGLDAIDEVVRLPDKHGQLAFLLHYRGGGIHRQCAASRAAIERMQQAEFIPRCITLFEKGFAAIRSADWAPYEAAGRAFAPALRAVESTMRDYGTGVADGTLLRLYRDIRTVHQRMQHYDPDEILDWLRALQQEIDAYAGRMASMCDTAIDRAAFERLCDRVRSSGFSIRRAEPLTTPDRRVPLGWTLVAERMAP